MNAVITTRPGGGALTPSGMGEAMQLADMMSRGRLVPKHLQGSPGDCLMVVEQAMRWGMSPFAVAQCTSVISGKLMFEGKLVAAALQSCGLLSARLSYAFTGEGDGRTCTCTGTIRGEDKPREAAVTLRDVRTANEMWKRQPDQQLIYSSTRVWGRRHAPEVMLGVYAPEEMEPARKAEPYAGTTIEATAEPAPELQKPVEDKARVKADGLIARVRACTDMEALHAIGRDEGVVKGCAWMVKNRPDLSREIDAAFADMHERLSGAEDETPHDPTTGELIDMEAL